MKRILPLILFAFIFAIPFSVKADDDAGAGAAAASDNAAPAAAPAVKSAKAMGHEPVESRIKELYTKLKITPDQEELWKTVTQQMRDSANEMKELAGKREEGAKDMSALDDLNSYSEIASLHAQEMKKFIDAFTPLYNAMSDTQKKNADEVFRGHKMAKHGKGKKS